MEAKCKQVPFGNLCCRNEGKMFTGVPVKGPVVSPSDPHACSPDAEGEAEDRQCCFCCAVLGSACKMRTWPWSERKAFGSFFLEDLLGVSLMNKQIVWVSPAESAVSVWLLS